jgi:hypothetical protein
VELKFILNKKKKIKGPSSLVTMAIFHFPEEQMILHIDLTAVMQ